MLHVISLGAGVQSTTMALMAAHGELGPMPDCAIFADTGWEPKAVYEHLDWLEKELPFPVHRVSAGNLRADTLGEGQGRASKFSRVPWFVRGKDGLAAMGRRQCTKEYKLYPIHRQVRAMLGGKTPKGGCSMWIGISMDEAIRMKPSSVQYIVPRWPLIDLRMTRRQCLAWMERQGYPPPPKSACIGCPFHHDDQWRALRDEAPAEWADAVAVDAKLRANVQRSGMRGAQYMHRSLVPLDQVDLSTAEDRGQLNLFLNECEGMCGV